MLRIQLLLCAALACFGIDAAAVEFRSATFEQQQFTVAAVNLTREKLELFWRDEHGVPIKRFVALEKMLARSGRRLIFGMNGGMYHGDFSPVGLFISSGRELVPLNLQKAEGNFFLQPNGVFAVTERGAVVVTSTEFKRLTSRVELATQSGPMLVIGGKLHPAFRRGSINRLLRNGVGVRSPPEVFFAVSETPVNFDEFARFFRDHLGCRNALFLDGTVSSLHAPRLRRSDFKMDLGPIIGITEPKARTSSAGSEPKRRVREPVGETGDRPANDPAATSRPAVPPQLHP